MDSSFFKKGDFEPSIDNSSLKDLGLSPQDYNILIKLRQTQYAKEIENDYDDWITNPI